METHETIEKIQKPLILFDGVCNWCIFWVQFVINRDTEKRFQFTPLQSVTGKRVLESIGFPSDHIHTMVFVEKGRYYLKSSAALHIVKRLNGAWPILFVFLIIPGFLRDRVYEFIGRNRYRWFGKKNSCLVPSPDVRERFLQ